MMRLEDILGSPDGFGIPLSPAQIAQARIIDGLELGDLADRDDVQDMCGGADVVEALRHPMGKPREVVLLSAIRTGKSQLAAAHSVASAAGGVDLGMLRGGELARYSIVSARKDNARATLDHLHGLMSKPAFRSLMVGEPTQEGVDIRHSSGRVVEVRVVAGSVAGTSLVSRWCAGVAFEESPRMGTKDYEVNLPDMRSATLGRLLPGAQILYPGSPWAPEGWAFDAFTEHFGRPSSELVVLRGRAWFMNPSWWTPARVEHYRRHNPRVYQTDLCANFGVSEDAAFDLEDIAASFAPRPELDPDAGLYLPCRAIVATDFSSLRRDDTVAILARMYVPRGERLNKVVNGVVQRDEDGKMIYLDIPTTNLLVVESILSWRPGEALMDQIVDTIAAEARAEGVYDIVGDQHAMATYEAMFRRKSMRFTAIPWTATNKEDAVLFLRRLLRERSLCLPESAKTLREQLGNYVERKTPSGYRYEGRGAKDDHAQALLTLAMAAEERLLPGAPAHLDRRRYALGRSGQIEVTR